MEAEPHVPLRLLCSAGELLLHQQGLKMQIERSRGHSAVNRDRVSVLSGLWTHSCCLSSLLRWFATPATTSTLNYIQSLLPVRLKWFLQVLIKLPTGGIKCWPAVWKNAIFAVRTAILGRRQEQEAAALLPGGHSLQLENSPSQEQLFSQAPHSPEPSLLDCHKFLFSYLLSNKSILRAL